MDHESAHLTRIKRHPARVGVAAALFVGLISLSGFAVAASPQSTVDNSPQASGTTVESALEGVSDPPVVQDATNVENDIVPADPPADMQEEAPPDPNLPVSDEPESDPPGPPVEAATPEGGEDSVNQESPGSTPDEQSLDVSGPEPFAAGPDGGNPPYLYWTAKTSDGDFMTGAQFQISRRGTLVWLDTTTISDCVGGPCGPAGDLDPDRGEFLVKQIEGTSVTNNSRWRIQAVAISGWNISPTGWQDSNDRTWSGQTLNFGNFSYQAQVGSIKVTAGGDRTSLSAKSGSGLGVAPNGTVFQAQRSGSLTYTCEVNDGTGSCVIVGVPAGGDGWNVSVKSLPDGWFASSQLGVMRTSNGAETLVDYYFQTPALTAGQVYSVTSSGTSGSWGGNYGGTYREDNRPSASRQRFSDDRLGISRNNPPRFAQCGLNVAFVLDQSNSMFYPISSSSTTSRNAVLKGAMHALIDGLVGTPTQFAIYTFASAADVAGKQPLTSLATSTTAQPLHTFVNTLKSNLNDSWPGDLGGTNWDSGLSQLQSIASSYDLVIFFTDGMPTIYGNPWAGAGAQTWFQMIEQAMFSANAIKAQGVPIVGLGAGMAPGPQTANLAAVTGPAQGNDFYLVSPGNEAEIVAALRELAGGACDSTLTIQKQIRDYQGTLITPSDQRSDSWEFANTISGPAGVTIEPTASTAARGDGQHGFANVEVKIPSGASSTISVAETLKDEYTFESAQCSFKGEARPTTVQIIDGKPTASFTIPNVGELPVGSAIIASCVFVNQEPPPTFLTLKKTVSKGAAAPTLWDLYARKGDSDPVINGAKTGSPSATKVVVQPGSYELWEANGPPGYGLNNLSCAKANPTDPGNPLNVPVTTENGRHYVNVSKFEDVTCTFDNAQVDAHLTLVKVVKNEHGGTATNQEWTLKAVGSATSFEGKSGSPSVTNRAVEAGTYVLSEFGGPAGYNQTSLGCVATGTSEPVSVHSGSVTLASGDDVTCTFTNTDRPGEVSWEKVDRSTPAKHLGGSVWVLTGTNANASYYPAGIEVVDCIAGPCTGLIDRDPTPGKFRVEGLNWGGYKLVEKSPPLGYKLLDREFTFTIRGDSLVAVLGQIVNEEVDYIDLPLTGGLAAAGFLLVGGGLIGVAVMSAATHRPNKRKSFRSMTSQDPS